MLNAQTTPESVARENVREIKVYMHERENA